ncbi:DUF5131 family protein [Mesorhizobium sp. VK4C]|uniref:DUF5131 family protein n=1 Tax=Mesorhizobium captivum TaxID=3072319 RepID=UPI002A24D740|nr:DUF5131 family protein [Mesorhizobium sp. VK4C]MDX8499014.1 DUF5131 family protein [Mesorhizobium sp. VK4C]
MPETAERIVWSCRDILAPFRWASRAVVRVAPDLFEPEVRGKFRDEVFATMALCPELRFELRTAHPRRYQEFVRTLAEDQAEYLAWRVSAATILRKLGRALEASGPGPQWPLRNVVLVD